MAMPGNRLALTTCTPLALTMKPASALGMGAEPPKDRPPVETFGTLVLMCADRQRAEGVWRKVRERAPVTGIAMLVAHDCPPFDEMATSAPFSVAIAAKRYFVPKPVRSTEVSVAGAA